MLPLKGQFVYKVKPNVAVSTDFLSNDLDLGTIGQLRLSGRKTKAADESSNLNRAINLLFLTL